MIREWKLVQRFTFYLQPNLNRKTLPAILTLQFDDVTVKTIYSSTIEKSASVTQTINLLIIITTLVIYAHFYYPHFSIRIRHPQVPRRSAFYRHLALSWLNTHHVQVLLQRVELASLCFLHDTFSQPEKT